MENKERIIRQFMDTVDSDVNYISDVGYIKMPSNMLAKLTLSISSRHNQFTRIHVQILEKGKGEVDSLSFYFADIESAYSTHQNRDSVQSMYVWRYQYEPLEWYILEPSKEALKGMGQAIVDYIELHSLRDF